MRSERFKLVCSRDPAIAHEQMRLDQMFEYQKKRDFGLVEPYLAAGKATIFHCREIPHRLWGSLVNAAGDNESERFVRAFRAGVERVENLYQDDGTIIPMWEPTDRFDGVACISSEQVYERFSEMERQEIGSVIYLRSFLPRRTAATFPLRSTLLTALEGLEFLPADASPSAAAQSSAPPQASATPTRAPTDKG